MKDCAEEEKIVYTNIRSIVVNKIEYKAMNANSNNMNVEKIK